jgi:hypothetical protein
MGRYLVKSHLEFETIQMDRITQNWGAPLNPLRTLDPNIDSSVLLASPGQLEINASAEVALNMEEASLDELCALKAKALQRQQQRLETLCASVEARDATTSDTSVQLKTLEEVASQRLDTLTPRTSITLQTLEEGAVQWLDKFCASMKTGNVTTSDIPIRLQTIEEGAGQGIDKLCTTMEARDAVVSDILARLKILEDGAVLREKKFQADIVALKEQHVEELLELQDDINKKHAEEMLEVRNKQEKQEREFERLGSIVARLEHSFSCTKQDVHYEELSSACQVKLNDLELWANRQVQSLETENLAQLGTCVRNHQGSMSEHKPCQDSFKEHTWNDVDKFRQEKDQLREEIASLKIDISGLDQKLESYMIQAVGWKEHQEDSLSQAETDASNSEQSCQGVQALYDKLAVPATDPTASAEIDCNPRLQALLLRVRSQEAAANSCSS